MITYGFTGCFLVVFFFLVPFRKLSIYISVFFEFRDGFEQWVSQCPYERILRIYISFEFTVDVRWWCICSEVKDGYKRSYMAAGAYGYVVVFQEM